MECIVFPKFYRELGPTELARLMGELGFDGVDVMVRAGYWVTDEGMARELPEFVRILHDFGLSAMNATTDLLDPRAPYLEQKIACLAQNGIRQFRLQHVAYRGLGTLEQTVSSARLALERFARLSEKHGIRAFIQTHGGTVHASASAAYRLVEGTDPRFVGVHHDPGNMICQAGHEDWAFGFELLGEYLCMVGVKNAGVVRSRSDPNGRAVWSREWTTLDAGVVDWDEVVRLLAEVGFRGPLCMHNFYEHGLEDLAAKTRRDLAHLRGALARVEKGSCSGILT